MSSTSSAKPGDGRKRVLILTDFFLPGTKAGGGVRTVANLVGRLGNEYDFFVITRNHDGRSDLTPYKNVDHDSWNDVGSAKVFYLPSRQITALRLIRLLANVSPDIVYLNSVFARPGVRYMLARWLGLVPDVPVIVAPIGNLAKGALRFKGLKKRLYLSVARHVGLYKNIHWKASSEMEGDEVAAAFGKRSRITIAPDLSPRQILQNFSLESKPKKKPGQARFAFYSRIDAKKNLIFLLDALSLVSNGDVDLAVAGPVDDEEYWDECKKRIADLPKNIKVEIHGVIPYEQGLELLIDSHFFVLPTLGENFGYVFLEALAAGCPLLISKHTIWGAIDRSNAGWTIPLSSADEWTKRLEYCVEMKPETYVELSKRARQIALDCINDPGSEAETREMFRSILAVE